MRNDRYPTHYGYQMFSPPYEMRAACNDTRATEPIVALAARTTCAACQATDPWRLAFKLERGNEPNPATVARSEP